jgi:hypothetical protein
MNQISLAIGLFCMGLVAFTTAPARAQTTGNGPYYATPSWDQQLPSSTRFVVLSNWIDTDFPSGGAAVLDRETGLVWERVPLVHSGGIAFIDALGQCWIAITGGRMGWRLPTPEEYMTLADLTQPGPPLVAGNPFQHVFDIGGVFAYWTASTRDSGTPGMAFLFTATGSIGWREKTASFGAWCVRGGSHALTNVEQ